MNLKSKKEKEMYSHTIVSNFPWIEEHLGKLVTDDPSVIETSLEEYSQVAYPDDSSVMHRTEIVDKYFSCDTVEEIIDTLENEAIILRDEWCTSTLKKLKEACPLALKVSLRSVSLCICLSLSLQ